jgi:hypothetical protein
MKKSEKFVVISIKSLLSHKQVQIKFAHESATWLFNVLCEIVKKIKSLRDVINLK